MRAEKSGEIPVEPVPDLSLPEFQAAAKLRQENRLAEARDALVLFLQKYPSGLHLEEAKDLLGDVNMRDTALRLSFAGKTGIHRAEWRCPGQDRDQDEDDAGIDHAHE